ncbi:MAG: 50S ribosomal protein L4 [Solirubrobacterales bacterium]|nr:50S ribosomal protein L4 [Solirubrobacterales bacterium]
MPDAIRLGGGAAVKLDPEAFDQRFNMPLVHETVLAELAALRQGTHATKTRGMVSGGGAKPWRQKGTGRARAGSSRSPIWKGGGTVFGPQPHHYTVKVNRKARRAALRSALSVHGQRGSVALLDGSSWSEPATKRAAAELAAWDVKGPYLLLVGVEETNAALSFRNLQSVVVKSVGTAGVADIMRAGGLIVSDAALELLSERATRPVRSEAVAA